MMTVAIVCDLEKTERDWRSVEKILQIRSIRSCFENTVFPTNAMK